MLTRRRFTQSIAVLPALGALTGLEGCRENQKPAGPRKVSAPTPVRLNVVFTGSWVFFAQPDSILAMTVDSKYHTPRYGQWDAVSGLPKNSLDPGKHTVAISGYVPAHQPSASQLMNSLAAEQKSLIFGGATLTTPVPASLASGLRVVSLPIPDWISASEIVLNMPIQPPNSPLLPPLLQYPLAQVFQYNKPGANNVFTNASGKQVPIAKLGNWHFDVIVEDGAPAGHVPMVFSQLMSLLTVNGQPLSNSLSLTNDDPGHPLPIEPGTWPPDVSGSELPGSGIEQKKGGPTSSCAAGSAGIGDGSGDMMRGS